MVAPYVVSHSGNCEFPQSAGLVVRKFFDTGVYSEVTGWNPAEFHFAHGAFKFGRRTPDAAQGIAFWIETSVEI
jgi:hypothetical protein